MQTNRILSREEASQLDLRLAGMSDELARAGDLFVLLFRNPQDGMSYIRFVTKDRIQQIETAPHDWETELVYYELQDTGEPRRWYSVAHPEAGKQPAIMLHYSVNRPVGALMGESDLTTMLPWLQRYSRMLEDRVRLHWAMRAFLWIVTVPSTKINEKQQQYANPMDAGSIIVKDDQEVWEAINPDLHGTDAQHDMKAVRGMIDAGSGYPPHWRGEGGDVNVATAEAMQGPPEKHLARRQQYFTFLLEDVLYHAYTRASALRSLPPLPTADYGQLFKATTPDVSTRDNTLLAEAAGKMAAAMQTLQGLLQSNTTPEFKQLVTDLILTFAGEIPAERDLDKLIQQPAALSTARERGQQ